jgi:DNA polymerase III subunit epsilon
MHFTAIDFETANNARVSACEIGLSRVEDGKVVETKSWLIKPVGPFLPWNVRIHGIRPDDVADAPNFWECWPDLAPWIDGQVLVAHNASFDVSVLRETCQHYGIPIPTFAFFCSLQVARGTWHELPSYSLGGLAHTHGLEPMNYHRAGDDAETCGRIVLKAARYHLAQDPEELLEATGLKLGKLSASGYEGTGKKNPSPKRIRRYYHRTG